MNLPVHVKTLRDNSFTQSDSRSLRDLDRALNPDAIRLLTFNIQVGIHTQAFRDYVTQGWRHVLPHRDRHQNLLKVADLIRDFDLVGLQEVDGGSLRSGFINQVEYLAARARLPYWYSQTNRDFGPLAQHGNGLLARVSPRELEDHKLPGMIPGRGAVVARWPLAGYPQDDDLLVVMLHLSLGHRSRKRQLAAVRRFVEGHKNVVVMGDMNTLSSQLHRRSELRAANLRPAADLLPTYPAWQPQLALDRFYVSENVQVKSSQTLACAVSDHLPLAIEIAVQP